MIRRPEVGSAANSYQILAKLATGGMAEIFLARGASVGGVERYVVLKRILPDRASDVHFVRMFLDEARLAAQLQHPNIAQVFDIGKLGDSFFFTMEYVHGETIRALLARGFALRRPLALGCALSIIAQSASGLHHAHERIGIDGRPLDIVHRDVSPSNLIASFEGHVKVVDFGVAKAAERTQETRTGTVKGKIAYLSPEQCKGEPIDRRSDLFSLGIVAWEMLTGERLFRRDSDFGNMTAIVTEDVPRPSSVRPDLPPLVDQLILQMLAKDPKRRFQRCDELVEAIEDVALRTQTTLSVTAVGRLMREMFGQRPEPWLELSALEKAREPVTVTSEPIPSEIVAPHADGIHGQLASVIDLESHRARFGVAVAPTVHAHVAPTADVLPPARLPAPAPDFAVATGSGADAVLPAPSRPVWPIILAVVVAASLVGVAVWFASSKSATPADAALVELLQPDAAQVAVVVVDAMPPPTPVDATVEPLDAEELAIEIVDADVAAAPDAAVAPPPEDDFVACSRGAMTTRRAATCTIAACAKAKAVTARTWFAQVPTASRTTVIARCKQEGVGLEPRRPPPPPPTKRDAGVSCDDDPLACQH